MKIYDAFDKIQDMPENISYDSLYAPVEVDVGKIKQMVFSSGSFSKKKKPFGKAFKFTVIAAVLTLTLIIGTTAFAQGQFRFLFHGYVNGEDSTPVYFGENQKFSSDKVNVRLMGLTGDNTKLYSVMEITKKDDSDFVDDYQNTYIQPYDEEFKINIPEMDELWSEKERDRHILKSQYEFSDAKTIKAQIDINGNQNGSYLTIQNHGLYFYHIDEVVYRFTGKESTEEFARIQYDIEKQYSPKLKENQFIKYDLDKNIYCIVTKTKSNFDYRISFEVNYEAAYKDFNLPKDNVLEIQKLKFYIQSVHAEASGITIKGHYEYAGKGAVVIDQLMSKQKFMVKMNDGSVIKPLYTELSFDSDESAEMQKGMMEVYYEFSGEDGNVELLNVINIQSVSFNDLIFR